MIHAQPGGEVFVAREGEPLRSIGRVVSAEWNLNGPSGVTVDVTPDVRGFRRAILDSMVRSVPAPPRNPGKLADYPSRVEHARAHRLRSEIRRRDRRRARTGRAPIQLGARSRPRMLEFTNALAVAGQAFARAGQAVRAFAEHLEPALVETQRRINDMVAAASLATVPHRFMAGAWDDAEGATPQGTIRDDVAAYQRRVEAEFAECARARRDQALAGPYITMDELRRQLEEVDYLAEERAEHYRRAFERIRDRATVNWPRRYATGGVIHERRDPDDDSIPVRISPGEVWCTPEMARRVAPGLLRQINASSATDELEQIQDGLEDLIGWRPGIAHVFAFPRPDDVTHHDRYLGEGALERDETSSVHSTDSSGTGAVWSDLMSRIDDLIEE